MDYNHGVVYKPDNIEKYAYKLERAYYEGIKYVRIYWIDFSNTRRCRILPRRYFGQLMKSNRPGMNMAKIALGLVDLAAPPPSAAFSAVGEYIYVPDLSTLRPLPFAPGHLGVLGYFEEKSPYQGNDGKETVEVPLCARSLLKRIVENARETLDVEFLVGIETEFILLSSTRPITASHTHQWSTSAALLAGSKEAAILEEIGDAMDNSGLSLQLLHAEAAPGQYEVVSGPLSPIDAADQVIFVRELIANVAAKHGLTATFAPRPFEGSPGSGVHIHVSVHRKGVSKPIEEMSAEESSFLAGLLDNLPAIPAITLPSPLSYKRMVDGIWSGGTYIHYGTENREAPIRLTNAKSPSSRNFELRFIDATANPYLALAAILGAGIAGVKSDKRLEAKDIDGTMSAFRMSEEERQALGITKRLPLNIQEARANLDASSILKEVLGETMVEGYLSVNKVLEEVLNKGEDEQERLSQSVEFYI